MAALPDQRYAQLDNFVAEQLGLSFALNRRRELERGFALAAHEFGFADEAACLDWLLAGPHDKRQIETLASHLTVGETYFFRDRRLFEALETQVLPHLLIGQRAGDKRLRLWSAGCCTGEEPYSLAILLHRMLPDLAEWNVSLLATDINPRFLQKAAEGVYGAWSFRDAPSWLKSKYFSPRPDGRFEILPAIRQMVSFDYLNLAEGVYPSLLNNTNAMDIVVCRNVLMYFVPERAQQVAANLRRSLVEGGWLAVSPTEISSALFAGFTSTHFPGAILYQKDSEAPSAPVANWPSLPATEPQAAPAFDWDAVLGQAVKQPAADPLPVAESLPLPPPTQLYETALALFEQGRYVEAAQTIESAASRSLLDADSLLLAARSYANQGGLAEALAWTEKAIARDKLNPGSHYLQATILQEQGRAEAAAAALRRALYLDPDFVLAHFGLGNLARRIGKPDEAQKHFANALGLLAGHGSDEPLPEAEGLTVGRLRDILQISTGKEVLA